MGWYKVECSHGPGHQGKDTWYIRAENIKFARDEAEYAIDSMHWDWPVWTVKRVRKFPRKERERLIAKKLREIRRLQFRIDEVNLEENELRRMRQHDNNKLFPCGVDFVICCLGEGEYGVEREATDCCRVRYGEPGDYGWPYEKVFKGMCMDCPHAIVERKPQIVYKSGE